jgi:hypothetical protein
VPGADRPRLDHVPFPPYLRKSGEPSMSRYAVPLTFTLLTIWVGIVFVLAAG